MRCFPHAEPINAFCYFSWKFFDKYTAIRYITSMLKVTYRNTPLRVLRRMQPKIARQIRDKIGAIAENPRNPRLDVRPLRGRPGYRLRFGNWRIIFEIGAETLDVLAIETRGDAYKPRKHK